MKTEYGKGNVSYVVKRRKIFDRNWKKRGIFFNLPYWHKNLNPHNFDIMHIEKNIGEPFFDKYIVVAHFKEIEDNERALHDLSLLGIQKSLHPQ